MNRVLKKLFLKYKTKVRIKNRTLQQNNNFEESAKIALFYSDRFPDQKGIENLIAELKAEGKEVNVLVFYHDRKNISTSRLHLTIQDVSFSGQVNKEEVSFFLKQNYDFAICLDMTNYYAIDYIFSLVQARCRIGIMHPDKKNLFEMIVLADKKETDLCREVLKYLKMIRTYGH